MSSPEHPETDDDVAFEVRNLRPGMSKRSAPRSPVERRTTRRQRLWRLAGVGAALVVALAVLVGSVPSIRNGVTAMVRSLTPAPLAPGSDLLYFPPNPPGITVALDGQRLATLPAPGDSHPLRLSRGEHTLNWHSSIFPFSPLNCTISVPAARGDTCPLAQQRTLVGAASGLSGRVLAPYASLDRLPTSQRTSLIGAVVDALDAAAATARVEPGEPFRNPQLGQLGGSMLATQPLQATLRYQVISEPGYSEPCILGQPAIPCRFGGQDCTLLCTVASAPAASGGVAPPTWTAAVLVRASWQYAAPDGSLVANDVGEAFGGQLATLRITYDRAGWHVALVLGHTDSLPVADDLVCDPARYWLSTTTWGFMLSNPPPGAQTQFISDGTPTDGCLVSLAQTPTQPALFLQRFGVLMAVNADVQNPLDHLPLVDAANRADAERLAASANISLP